MKTKIMVSGVVFVVIALVLVGGSCVQNKTDKNILTEQQIVSIATQKLIAERMPLDHRKIYCDVDNKKWAEKFQRMKQENPDFVKQKLSMLENRDYQTVIYELERTEKWVYGDSIRVGGSTWVFVDKKTGEVVTFFGER